MRMTREKHLQYMTRMAPLLLVATLLQAFLYFKFAPTALAVDVSVLVVTGIATIIVAFWAYNSLHKVTLYRNYVSLKVDLLKYEEEILYRSVEDIRIEPSRHAYYNVTLNLKDGRKYKIYYLDDAHLLKKMVEDAHSGK